MNGPLSRPISQLFSTIWGYLRASRNYPGQSDNLYKFVVSTLAITGCLRTALISTGWSIILHNTPWLPCFKITEIQFTEIEKYGRQNLRDTYLIINLQCILNSNTYYIYIHYAHNTPRVICLRIITIHFS